jgi:hypothetical protein
MPDIEVDTDDLITDAHTYWDAWSDKLRAIGDDVPASCSTVTVQDWSNIPGAQSVRAAFADLLGQVGGFLQTGSEVLEGVARTLLLSAEEYVRAEDGNEAELARIEYELGRL